jgi:hypothetical protein
MEEVQKTKRERTKYNTRTRTNMNLNDDFQTPSSFHSHSNARDAPRRVAGWAVVDDD